MTMDDYWYQAGGNTVYRHPPVNVIEEVRQFCASCKLRLELLQPSITR
jgi:hypothetical protein